MSVPVHASNGHADKVVVAGYLVRCPLGGYAWQTLQYLLSLRQLGFDPYFYEDTAYVADCFDPVTGRMHAACEHGVDVAAAFLEQFGFAQRWAFWNAAEDRHFGLTRAETAAVLHDARFFIALAAVNRMPKRPGQPQLFVDLDPTFTQLRLDEGDRGLRDLLDAHDLHFTIGENIGTPECPIPTGGYVWRRTRQPIVLPLWEPLPAGPPAAFTTIGRWNETRRDIRFRGEVYSWNKRVEWLKFIDLPLRTGQAFQLAMDVEKTEGDAERLRQHGWQVVDPIAVSADPLRYRQFIRGSKGEFTVAKDLNVRLHSGWFSDRSACYLAAGRPVITQDTGFDRILPTGAGLLSVRTLDEAVAATIAISTDYATHAAAARRIAENCFDGRRVVADMLSCL